MEDGGKPTPRSPRVAALINYIEGSVDFPFARIAAFDFSGDNDIVDLLIEPELVQDRAVAIHDVEPVRLVFPVSVDGPPSIFSQRADFPLDLVHTNYEPSGNGRCLCVWEENWHDLSRNLTAQRLIERIRNWFSRTASGDLHDPDQPLEPMILATSSTLVVPPGPPPTEWHGVVVEDDEDRLTAVLDANPRKNGCRPVPFAIFSLEVEPQVHGALHHRPRDLQTLHDLVGELGRDLFGALEVWLLEQLPLGDRVIALLIAIPKRRVADGEVEAWEHWAFSPTEKIESLAQRLGLVERDPDTGRFGRLLTKAPVEKPSEITLYGWRVVQRLDHATARLHAGNPADRDASLVGIGAGAIGSNVMLNTKRAGIGKWTVIDNDINLPHNLGRQIHSDAMTGFPKAETTALLLDTCLAQGGDTHIRANFLVPGAAAEAVREAVKAADLTVDFSASPSVLGALSDNAEIARAASFFFGPDGRDLVVLAEDKARTVFLDEIEAYYFLCAGTDPLLANHLASARADMVRYANACQDITRRLPPWQVQTLSGIAAGRLLSLVEEEQAIALIWRLNAGSGAVTPMELNLTPVRRHKFDDFRVTVSEAVIGAMRRLREQRAPNETGGVLLGSFDLSRRVLHVVAALPAPPDSRQSPTYFIRGAKYLKPIVEGIETRSAGSIVYVGEWHSHPDGAKVEPSGDDELVFKHLETHLDPTGAPYVMAICGAPETWIRAGWHSWRVGEGVMRHD